MNTHSASLARPLSSIHAAILSLAVAATLWAMSGHAHAASIGVNFQVTFGGGPDVIAPSDLAGAAPFAQTHFNNISPFQGAFGPALNDDSGTPSTAKVIISAPSGSGFATYSPDPNERLNDGSASGYTNGILSFTLTNIPYASYSLVVYDFPNISGTVQGVTVGGTTFYTRSPSPFAPGYFDGNPATPFTYTRGTSTNSAAPTPISNYVVFNGLTNSTTTVTASLVSGSSSGPFIGGFQIVQTLPPGPRLSVDFYAGLTIEAGVGTTNRIEYVTNLGDTNWSTLTNLVLPQSPYLFFDATSPRTQRRFYRAVQVP